MKSANLADLQREGLFLQLPHARRFLGRFIRVAAEVEYTVDHDATQFGKEGQFALAGVIGYPFGADVQIAADVRRIGVRKSYDVGKRIVIEIIDVEAVQVGVVAKDVSEPTERGAVMTDDAFDPNAQSREIDGFRPLYVNKVKFDGRLRLEIRKRRREKIGQIGGD